MKKGGSVQSAILHTENGEFVEIFYEWVPDGMFDYTVIERPERTFYRLDDVDAERVPDVLMKTESVALDKKVIINKFLCRMGYSNLWKCFLLSRYKAIGMDSESEEQWRK
jgi:hypothetical protein